jgi:5'-nucleotidase
MTAAAPHVLLTNDDGVAAEGLNSLRDALIELGAQVSVIAPDGERSGMARAISFSRPVSLTEAGGSDGHRMFALTGSPVDCVRVGLLSELLPPVQLVVSGINHGLNIGDDWTYSGTVGAALEAALLDVPGIAISQQAQDGSFRFNDTVLSLSFHHARRAAEIVLAVIANPPPERTVLNVNLPAVEGAPPVALTRAGRRFYERGYVEATSGVGEAPEYYPYGMPSDPAPAFDDAPGTDFAAVRAGCISISLIGAGAANRATGAGESWFRQALAGFDGDGAAASPAARDGAAEAFADGVTEEQRETIRTLLAGFALGAAAPPPYAVSRLQAGANNQNFVIDAGDGRYVLRVASPTAARFNLDRVRNVRAHEAAAAAGVAPEIVASKLPEGHYLARFIDGPGLNNERVHHPGIVDAVGRALRALHGAQGIEGSFSSFADTRRYLAIAVEEGLRLPGELDALMLKADQIERVFSDLAVPDRVCHNDLVPQNLIETATGVQLVDFEFAGMGNPYFDLGNFSADAELSDAERGELVAAYFGAFDRSEDARVRLMVFMSGLREALWATVAEPVLGGFEWDYRAWAEENLRRAREAATNDIFYQLLAVARSRPADRDAGAQ